MNKSNVVKKENILRIYVDGASRNNPGHSACAFIFLKNGDSTPITSYVEYIGKATNNIAEYEAIIRALENAVKYTRWDVIIYSDSELVVNQLNGVYRVKKEHLRKKLERIYSLITFFESVSFQHVPRYNKFIAKCDSLCNKKLDEMEGKN